MYTVSNEDLYKRIQELSILDQKQLDALLQESKEENTHLATLIYQKDLISDENLGQTIADLIGMPFVRLSQVDIPDEVLKIIPEIVARSQKHISFSRQENTLHIATSTPGNIELIENIRKKTGLNPVVHYATEIDIAGAFIRYKKDASQTFEQIISSQVKQAEHTGEAEPPIIAIVEAIITHAFENKASDIHIEPSKNHSLIRMRIDGVLHDVVKLPLQLHSHIVLRIKVMAQLKTDQHQAAQDGKIIFPTQSEQLDLRVSLVPITGGEKIVMRLLSEQYRRFSLTDLGLSDADFKKVEEAYHKPHGMILVTGPTGSGKTTTLYSVLKLLNNRDVNIMTIEDPVEYNMERVNQIQVNTQTNLTFAAGLRSIVRQDPDIILVGEIRDEETAGIAVNSAMTGHLVLSTLHTNDAATAIPRLIDMQVEPFLISSTTQIIVAQRLVRKICMKCRVGIELKETAQNKHIYAQLQKITDAKNVTVYQGKGCEICHQTGYEGRIGIFEVLVMDDALREAVVAQKDAATIAGLAQKAGMTTMLQDGIHKVQEGTTTLDEVLRVTKE